LYCTHSISVQVQVLKNGITYLVAVLEFKQVFLVKMATGPRNIPCYVCICDFV